MRAPLACKLLILLLGPCTLQPHTVALCLQSPSCSHFTEWCSNPGNTLPLSLGISPRIQRAACVLGSESESGGLQASRIPHFLFCSMIMALTSHGCHGQQRASRCLGMLGLDT